MKEYQIVENGIVIGRFQDEHDRNVAFDNFCNDRNSSYLKNTRVET